MNGPDRLAAAGQSLWIDHITRGLLDSGTLQRYVDRLHVTGLTSNPTIFDEAITSGSEYDEDIRARAAGGAKGEELFLALAIADLARAADLFRPAHQRSHGVDGWVSLELPPGLARDTRGSIEAARELYERAGRPNVYIKIPGTPEGIPAIEESLFAGIPVNVTLLFSPGQYGAAAGAWLRAIERRVRARLDPVVHSVASVFISRWDVAVAKQVAPALANQLGLAVAGQVYREYCALLESDRWLRLANHGARAQRLLWASTGTKDPGASDTLYVEALVAPFTVDTMPERTLLALADHGQPREPMRPDGGDADAQLERFRAVGVDVEALGQRLQEEGELAFVRSWNDLMRRLDEKSAAVQAAGGKRP
jgi:transaldolase